MCYVDSLDDQDTVFDFDVARGVGLETTVSGGDATCFQRSPEGAVQSASGRGHQVIQGCGVVLELAFVHAVVLVDGAVRSEGDGLGCDW